MENLFCLLSLQQRLSLRNIFITAYKAIYNRRYLIVSTLISKNDRKH